MRTPLLLAAVALLAACAVQPDAVSERERHTDRGEVRIVVVADLNSAYGSTEYEPEVHDAVRRIREEWRPDLVVAAGDMIAGQMPDLSDANVRAMWAAFDSVFARPLREAGIPFGPALGNHDGSWYPAHARDRRFAVEHWRHPAHDPGVDFVDRAEFPVYYTFERDGVFVLVWDATYRGTAEDTEMMAWVERSLSSPAAREARYRIVLGHLPLYAVAEGRNLPGEVLDHADWLRELLERHGVDLYVSGHHHAYYPGRRGRLELLHAGALGQGARPLVGDTAAPVQTVTIVDFHLDADSIAYTTYAYRERNGTRPTRLEIDELPEVIRGINGYVVRRDLEEWRSSAQPPRVLIR